MEITKPCNLRKLRTKNQLAACRSLGFSSLRPCILHSVHMSDIDSQLTVVVIYLLLKIDTADDVTGRSCICNVRTSCVWLHFTAAVLLSMMVLLGSNFTDCRCHDHKSTACRCCTAASCSTVLSCVTLHRVAVSSAPHCTVMHCKMLLCFSCIAD